MRAAAAVTLLLGLPLTVSAADRVEIGSRVRIAGIGRPPDGSASVGGRMAGVVRASDAETLTIEVASGGELTYRWNELDRLEASLGPRSRSWGGLRGAGRGALVGSALGLALLAVAKSKGNLDAGVTGLAAPVAGATVGLGIGLASPGERWSRVEVGRAQVRVAPTTGPRGRGAGLAVSVGF